MSVAPRLSLTKPWRWRNGWALLLAGACGGPQDPGKANATCFRDDDCMAGLICVAPGMGDTARVCSDDPTPLISNVEAPPVVEMGGAAMGGTSAAAGGGMAPVAGTSPAAGSASGGSAAGGSSPSAGSGGNAAAGTAGTAGTGVAGTGGSDSAGSAGTGGTGGTDAVGGAPA